MRSIFFTTEAWEDYQFWVNQDRKTIKKINKLISEMQRNPFDGIGKPEPLKENHAGYWSRRIDEKNRLIYNITDKEVQTVACRFRY